MRPRKSAILGIYAIALAASLAVGSRGIAYWDAGDYVRLALRGGVSGLLLGRPLFLGVSRGLAWAVVHAGAPAWAIEPVLRHFWTLFAAAAAPLLSLLVSRLGLGAPAAIASGLCLAVAPSFAHTAHQVLTDGPALALALGALVIALCGDGAPRAARTACAAAVMACAIATRETAAVAALSLLLLLWPRRGQVALAAAVMLGVVFVAVLASHGGTLASLRAWAAAMRRSSSTHPLGPREVGLSLVWLLSLGPLPVVVGVAGLRRLPAGPARAVAFPAAVATALLFLYPDGSFSPRYFLAVAPLGLLVSAAPTVGAWLASPRRPWLAAALCLPLALTPLSARRANALADAGRAIGPRLATLPDGTLLVPGHLCPQVGAWLAAEDAVSSHARGLPIPPQRLSTLCPGWDWPEDRAALFRRLDAARCEGRVVALATDDDAWEGRREVPARDGVRAYALAAGALERDDRGGFAVLRPIWRDDARCPR